MLIQLRPSIGVTRPGRQRLVLIGVTGIVVTGVAMIESWRGWPYAPFPLVHVLLTLVLPLAATGIALERPSREQLRLLGAPLLVALLFAAIFLLGYTALLSLTGRASDPHWNLWEAYRGLGRLYVARYDRVTIGLAGYLLLGVWPMFGEELFYRGFLFKGLLPYSSPVVAGGCSSLLFGLRHAGQLVYLWPDYPVVAAAAYFLWAFGLGLVWCWAYRRTGSLTLCVLTHGANLFLAPAVLLLLLR